MHQPKTSTDRHSPRPARAGAPRSLCLIGSALGVIAAGLTLRTGGYAIGLPFVIVKYGGSLLWASMVYLLVAAFLPRLSAVRLALGAFGVALAVEFFRLVHTPSLDAFRLTVPGALLLGRIFSLWNILAYALGIAAAAGLDQFLASRRDRS